MSDSSGSGKGPLTPVLKATPAALIGVGAVGVVASAGLNPVAWTAVATGAALLVSKALGKGGDNG